MNRAILLIAVLLVINLVACNEKKTTTAIQKTEVSINQINAILAHDRDSLSKKVVSDFYQWYINDVYLKHIYDYDCAPYKKYNNKYGLDIEKYKQTLNKVSFFSVLYKKYLVKKIFDVMRQCLVRI